MVSDSAHTRPAFLWDVTVTEAELRAHLATADPDIRAQWQGRVLREARFNEVWKYVTLDEVVRDWPRIRRHLGRSRTFWEFLLDGWRAHGFLPAE
ncbi:MAG: hypothetical protein KC776_15185 [Myxococcales bacterium]|nr:hypothetical protein [Myxococcales bacterium]MCB9576299.1 hypothetical protein [Polyangiaceae bacterium]